MASRIIRIKIPSELVDALEEAARADEYSGSVSIVGGVAYLEDSVSDSFSKVQDLCMKDRLPHDLSYYSDNEASPRRWVCYRPDTKHGFDDYIVGEALPPDIKPLAEC